MSGEEREGGRKVGQVTSPLVWWAFAVQRFLLCPHVLLCVCLQVHLLALTPFQCWGSSPVQCWGSSPGSKCTLKKCRCDVSHVRWLAWWYIYIFVPLRSLNDIKDREICCYSISCKERENIGEFAGGVVVQPGSDRPTLNSGHSYRCCFQGVRLVF